MTSCNVIGLLVSVVGFPCSQRVAFNALSSRLRAASLNSGFKALLSNRAQIDEYCK